MFLPRVIVFWSPFEINSTLPSQKSGEPSSLSSLTSPSKLTLPDLWTVVVIGAWTLKLSLKFAVCALLLRTIPTLLLPSKYGVAAAPKVSDLSELKLEFNVTSLPLAGANVV